MLKTRRRVLFLCVAAVMVGLAVGVWLLWPRTAITRDNAARIQKGMTRAEVMAVLGGPPRWEPTGPLDLDEADDRMPSATLRWINCEIRADFDPEGGARAKWQSSEVAIYIWWDAAGTVDSCEFFPLRRAGKPSRLAPPLAWPIAPTFTDPRRPTSKAIERAFTILSRARHIFRRRLFRRRDQPTGFSSIVPSGLRTNCRTPFPSADSTRTRSPTCPV